MKYIFLPQVIPIPITVPVKFPENEAISKPIEQRNPPNIVITRHPNLLTKALENGAKKSGKLTNNEAIMPTVCSSSLRSSLIKCIRIPNEKRTPSATKCIQNEAKTITHLHDVVRRTTVSFEDISVVFDS
jgi:hypothetical protein